MKIKWKIVLSVTLLITCLIAVTDFVFSSQISKLVNNTKTEELTNYSKLGLTMIDAYYPGDWRTDGEKLYKGDTLINDNYQVVDAITKNTDILATLFLGDTRVSTTVKDENGKRKVGTKADPKVVSAVINDGKEYVGTVDVAGSKAKTYYVPLKNGEGKTIGMWFVGVYVQQQQKEIQAVMLSITLILLVLLLLGFIITFFLGRSIAKAIEHIQLRINDMESGNFDLQFNANLAKGKDEIGSSIQSFINMQDKIKQIIRGIKEEFGKMEESMVHTVSNVNNVNSDIQDITAITEELSASMEETAASTQAVSATTGVIENEISKVSDQSAQGQNIASEIKQRAEKLKLEALESQKNAVAIYKEANQKLKESIEKTSAIEEIKALSHSIMEITEQTNLLSLNAAIESARAGEAGKGFAVVAAEIRVLADNSQMAVSKIESISNDIAEAVNGLVKDSTSLLAFVDNQVIKDYDTMVKTGEQYSSDAGTVDHMVTNIKNSSEQLYDSIQHIRKAMEEISTTSLQGASDSKEIAEKSASISMKAGQVLEQSNNNQESVVSLKEMVQFFHV